MWKCNARLRRRPDGAAQASGAAGIDTTTAPSPGRGLTTVALAVAALSVAAGTAAAASSPGGRSTPMTGAPPPAASGAPRTPAEGSVARPSPIPGDSAEPASGPGSAAGWRVALHYGADAPLPMLAAFDIVVVEPGHGHDPVEFDRASGGRSALYAYVSVGEVRSGARDGPEWPAAMLAGENRVWGSRIVDPAHPAWPEWFVDRLVAPLWARGYRGFFLDTLDAYHALGGADDVRAARQAGLVEALRRLKRRFPDARLIANRGFELLADIHPLLEGVAAESLFGRWNQALARYQSVPEADRRWLLERFAQARALGLRTLAIDYAPPNDRARQRRLAADILALGITPYVTDGALATIGTGAIQVQPREVLLVNDGGPSINNTAQRLLAMPLQYLGYTLRPLDIRSEPPPGGALADRYAAVVGLFDGRADPTAGRRWLELLGDARRAGVPIALVNGFGPAPARDVAQRLDLRPLRRPPRGRLALVGEPSPIAGYEAPLLPGAPELAIAVSPEHRPLIVQQDPSGNRFTTAAVTPWGGFLQAPHGYLEDPSGGYWIVDPIAFLGQALAASALPAVPDVTTENGRRLFFAHIDGDGFASRAEIPGAPFAAQVMLEQFLDRYRVPHTVSVIEAEVAPHGLYPLTSGSLESIARRIFALDHVEIASHSYSHPFFWQAAMAGAAAGGGAAVRAGLLPRHAAYGLHLPLPGYRVSADREIAGSAAYIDTRLAPPGKRTRMMLWTGDCDPPAAALAVAREAGLLAMNGGDTTITRRAPTLSLVSGLSMRKGDELQVLAPNQNENVYTNDWTGPFYGFERVIETFELTERPRRLKPINLYYHTYSASKAASIAALHKVYRHVLAQPIHPVHASDYVTKVVDYESLTVSRLIEPAGVPTDGQAWEIRGRGDLRTLRLPASVLKRIDWHASRGLAGIEPGPDGAWLHTGGGRVRLKLADAPVRAPPPPLLAWANGRIDDLERGPGSMRFRFTGHVAGRLALRHDAHCRVRLDGRPTLPVRRSPADDVLPLPLHEYGISQHAARSGTLVSVHC